MCVRACECACVCVRVSVHACVCLCLCGGACACHVCEPAYANEVSTALMTEWWQLALPVAITEACNVQLNCVVAVPDWVVLDGIGN